MIIDCICLLTQIFDEISIVFTSSIYTKHKHQVKKAGTHNSVDNQPTELEHFVHSFFVDRGTLDPSTETF